LSAQFGATTAFQSGIPVRVAAGETVERIDIALPVAAAVGGRVVDEAGEPLADIRVELLRTPDSKLSSVETVQTGSSRAVYTDDGGRFRLFELAEGNYTLVALADLSHVLDGCTNCHHVPFEPAIETVLSLPRVLRPSPLVHFRHERWARGYTQQIVASEAKTRSYDWGFLEGLWQTQPQ
jgi:5-hydroxyisourate hydrolase-like protein (transthyretin family)